MELELGRVSYLDSKSQNYETKQPTTYFLSVLKSSPTLVYGQQVKMDNMKVSIFLEKNAFTEEAGIIPLIHSPQTEQSLVFRGARKHVISCCET